MGLAAMASTAHETVTGVAAARASGTRALRAVAGLHQHIALLDRRPASWGDILGGRLFQALPSFSSLDATLRELERLVEKGHGDLVLTDGDQTMRIEELRDQLAETLVTLAPMRRLAQSN